MDRFAAASEQRLREWQEQEGVTFDPVVPAPDPTASRDAGDVPAGTPAAARVTDPPRTRWGAAPTSADRRGPACP